MIVTLVRTHARPTCTLGRLYIDAAFECYTLEDPVRDGPKIPGDTAIPAGVYGLVVTPSPRFKRRLPLVVGVPGFDGIRIHVGNTAKDTEGCILVGRRLGDDAVLESRLAFDTLFAKLDTQAASLVVLSL